MAAGRRIGRALAVVALVLGAAGVLATAHVATMHKVTRSSAMRPIVTLNSPLLFAFDGDAFVPGGGVNDTSSACRSDGGTVGSGGTTGDATGGGGGAGVGGHSGSTGAPVAARG